MKSTHRTMTVAELVELDAQEALQVDAEYQRGAEWSVKQERLLIDSLFRGYSIPLFYFHKQTRASLHAKCIVIDEKRALITSANFTEAAHERNIEAGTVITDTILARALKAQFDTLVDCGALKRVPGL